MTLFEIERETVSNDKLKFLCEKNLKVRFSNIYLKYNLPLLVQQLKLKNHGLVSENTHLFHGACTLKKQEKTLPTKKKHVPSQRKRQWLVTMFITQYL